MRIRFLVFAFTMAFAQAALAHEINGFVVGVHDGDTITVLDAQKAQYHIRLVGIDAPELAQPFGAASKHSLSQKVYGKQVKITYDGRDMYGRVLGTVWFMGNDQNPVNANLLQVKEGMAWVYRSCRRVHEYVLEVGSICSPNAEGQPFLPLEKEASAHKLGLWADAHPVEPWAFRKTTRKTEGSFNKTRPGYN